jgi:hypothetical protein
VAPEKENTVMDTWENIFDEITHEIDTKTLKTRSVKSNLSFARKYCQTIASPRLMATCLQSVQQALSFDVIHQDQKTRAVLSIIDALPFILHLSHQTVTTATAAEKRSAQLCFLLTRALATGEDIFNNGATSISHENTEVEQSIQDGYITYRADQRSRQTVPQRIVAAVNASVPNWEYLHTFARSDRLEEWFTRFNLWDVEVIVIVWCVAMVCGNDPGLQREGYFLYLLYLWARRRENQQSRKQYPVKKFLAFTSVSERWPTLEDYETKYVKLYS